MRKVVVIALFSALALSGCGKNSTGRLGGSQGACHIRFFPTRDSRSHLSLLESYGTNGFVCPYSADGGDSIDLYTDADHEGGCPSIKPAGVKIAQVTKIDPYDAGRIFSTCVPSVVAQARSRPLQERETYELLAMHPDRPFSEGMPFAKLGQQIDKTLRLSGEPVARWQAAPGVLCFETFGTEPFDPLVDLQKMGARIPLDFRENKTPGWNCDAVLETRRREVAAARQRQASAAQ